MILAIDPGETVGVCEMEEDGTLLEAWELAIEDFYDWLFITSYRFFDAIVVEDYRLLQGKQMQQTGSKFPAAQVIGALQLYSRIIHTELVFQSPQILRLTEMHMHWPVHLPTSHVPDYLSAELHALHYAETQGVKSETLRALNPAIIVP